MIIIYSCWVHEIPEAWVLGKWHKKCVLEKSACIYIIQHSSWDTINYYVSTCAHTLHHLHIHLSFPHKFVLYLNLTPPALPACFSTHDIASWLLLFQFEKLDCHADIQLGVWTAGGKWTLGFLCRKKPIKISKAYFKEYLNTQRILSTAR